MPRVMMSVASTVSDEEGPHHVLSVPHTDLLPHPGLAYNKSRMHEFNLYG